MLENASLTSQVNQHCDYIGRLESKIDRGAQSLGGGTGRAKLKLLELQADHQCAMFQREVSSYMMKMSNGEIMHTWSQTEMFGLNENFGLIEE